VSALPKTGLQKALTTSASTFLLMMACILVNELARLVLLKDFLLQLELDEAVATEESTVLEPSEKENEKDADTPST
jgi:hypothetical protein